MSPIDSEHSTSNIWQLPLLRSPSRGERGGGGEGGNVVFQQVSKTQRSIIMANKVSDGLESADLRLQQEISQCIHMH